MGIGEIIAFVLTILGWISKFFGEKREQAKRLVDDIQYHAKQTSISVKKHKASTLQKLNLFHKRKALLEKRKKKDPTTYGD